MKIAVIGASRGIGKELASQGEAAGHEVVAFSRSGPGYKGDVKDFESIADALAGCDAVAITLGLPAVKAIGPPLARRSNTLSRGTENVIKAMRQLGVKRLICVTAIGAGESFNDCTLITKLVLRYGLRWLFKEKEAQEKLIKESGLEWTIIRPTALTNGPGRKPAVAEKLPSGLLTHVSRKDVARVILTKLKDADSLNKALTVSYKPRFGDSVRWVAGYFGLG